MKRLLLAVLLLAGCGPTPLEKYLQDDQVLRDNANAASRAYVNCNRAKQSCKAESDAVERTTQAFLGHYSSRAMEPEVGPGFMCQTVPVGSNVWTYCR